MAEFIKEIIEQMNDSEKLFTKGEEKKNYVKLRIKKKMLSGIWEENEDLIDSTIEAVVAFSKIKQKRKKCKNIFGCV